MAHIMGMTFASSDRVFAMDESGGNFAASAPIGASSSALSVGQLTSPNFRIYVGTTGGAIALFEDSLLTAPPQLFQVTNQIFFWSLYHASGVLYVGTGDFSSPGPFSFIALNDRTFSPRWQVSSAGPVMYPAGVAYDGNVPKQVIFSSGNPNPQVRALDVATGAELWSVPDVALGQHIHQGVVYYGDLNDNSLKARSTSDGTLIWRFTNPRNFNFQRPTAAGGVVWATTEGNQIYALRVSDGAVLWEVEINGHPGVPVVHFDHTWGTSLVAVAEQNGAVPGYLKAFDPNTGRALWTSSDPVRSRVGAVPIPSSFLTSKTAFKCRWAPLTGR